MYAQLKEQGREVVRSRPSQAFALAIWWCPFCDTSNQLRQDNLGDFMPCGKCGAVLVEKAPVSLPSAKVVSTPERSYAPVSVVDEQAGPTVPEPTAPARDVPKPRTRGISPSRRGRA